MARDENLPWPRGTTYFGSGTADATSGAQYEGKEYVVADVDPTARVGTKRTGRQVRLRIIRNVGSFALLPKRLANVENTAGKAGQQADGHATVTAERVQGVVDEYLPSTGIPANDLGYIVVEGPALCLTDLAGGANNVIALNGRVVALTAATSGATTSGRVAPQDLTGATAVLGNQVQNCIGTALTAKTTDNTNADILVDVGKF